MKFISNLVLTLLVFFLSQVSHAKLFRNAYLSFELPPNWNCKLEQTEWVCVNKYSQRSKEAIIILTAKEVGPSDSLPAFTAHLQRPKALTTKAGKTKMSKVYHVKQRNINNQTWIDGMHGGSEVTNYYTRYLATIKNRIAVLITFSAHVKHYTKYSNDFMKAITSLRVVADKSILANRPKHHIRKSHETIGAPIGSAIPSDMMSDEFPEEDSGGSSDMESKLIGIALLLGAIGFYLLRKKKKG